MTAFAQSKEALAFGWNTFKKRPGIFVGTGLILLLISIATDIDHEVFWNLLGKEVTDGVNLLISLVVSTFVGMGLVSFYLRAHDDVTAVSLRDLWNPSQFWAYLGTTVCVTALVILGVLALIVPGVIVALAASFAGYLVVERGRTPIRAIKESFALTKGHRMTLFVLTVLSALVNIAGFCALLVGMLVTIPVTTLAFAHMYRRIAGTDSVHTETQSA